MAHPREKRQRKRNYKGKTQFGIEKKPNYNQQRKQQEPETPAPFKEEKLLGLLGDPATERLIVIEVIAKLGDAARRNSMRMLGQPTLGRFPFTILLFMAILRHDKLWRQGQDVRRIRFDHHRRYGTVIIVDFPLVVLAL